MTLMKVSTEDDLEALRNHIVRSAIEQAKSPMAASVKPVAPELLALFDRLAELGRTLRS